MPELDGPDGRAGTLTMDQRLALLAVIERDTGSQFSSRHRMEWLCQRIPGWDHGGDIGWLSQRAAGDLLAQAAGISPDESHGGLSATESRQAFA